MAGRRSKYPLEFKQEAVRLVQKESLTYTQVGEDLGVDKSTVRTWCKLAAEGRLGTVTSPARPMSAEDEVVKLRKEVRILREEREILKKAAAFFAKESR
jgi:transposase